MVEVIKYRCDFCKKVFANKSYCMKHEANCYHNPVTRACASCDFLFSGHDFMPLCLKNKDVQTKLRNNCSDYLENETMEMEERLSMVCKVDSDAARERSEARFKKAPDIRGFIDLINETVAKNVDNCSDY